MSSQTTLADSAAIQVDQAQEYQDCLACRVIGTGALGGLGVYALHQSRAHMPGTLAGKRVMAGLGVCFLVASALRWTK